MAKVACAVPPLASSNAPSSSRSHCDDASASPSGSVADEVSVIAWPASGVRSETAKLAMGARVPVVNVREAAPVAPSPSVRRSANEDTPMLIVAEAVSPLPSS